MNRLICVWVCAKNKQICAVGIGLLAHKSSFGYSRDFLNAFIAMPPEIFSPPYLQTCAVGVYGNDAIFSKAVPQSTIAKRPGLGSTKRDNVAG